MTPLFLDPLLKNSLSETRRMLFEGELLPFLQAGQAGFSECLIGVTYKNEKHYCHRGFSLLVLTLEFQKKDEACSHEKEVIIHYRSNLSAVGFEAVSAWTYPDDPILVNLPSLSRSSDFLRTAAWENPIDLFLPADEEICAQRLLYNPCRRVTYLISSADTNKCYILKMVAKNEFRSFFKKAEAIQHSPLGGQLILPKLATYSEQDGLFLYHYIPGLQVKKLKEKLGTEKEDPIFREVVKILTVIHQTSITLPHLDLLKKMEGLERDGGMMDDWRALKSHYSPFKQSGADLIRPLIDLFIDSFKHVGLPHSNMIHNSFSVKHLLYQPGGAGADVSHGLGILDWDSAVLGPREKDIGQFLAGYANRPNDCETFLDLYESKASKKIDRRKVDDFMRYQWLQKLIRKGLKQNDLTESYLNEVKSFVEESRQKMEQ